MGCSSGQQSYGGSILTSQELFGSLVAKEYALLAECRLLLAGEFVCSKLPLPFVGTISHGEPGVCLREAVLQHSEKMVNGGISTMPAFVQAVGRLTLRLQQNSVESVR